SAARIRRRRLLLDVGEPLAVRAPRDFALAGLLAAAAAAAARRRRLRIDGLRVVLHAEVERALAHLGERGALVVPDLLDLAEAADRDVVGERPGHAGHARVLAVGRHVDRPDHRRLADLLHAAAADVDQGELPGRVPLE